MPPEAAMKFRVDFVYSEDGFEKEADKFLEETGKEDERRGGKLRQQRKAMEQAAAEIVSPSDSPEVKLQKIYARSAEDPQHIVRKLKRANRSRKRAQGERNQQCGECLERGYGDGYQSPGYFWGLARAAGFDASPVRIATRDDHFFRAGMMRIRDLNTNVVLVKLNGKDAYFDPGAAFTPFGLLPWSETNTAGLKLDKDGGTWDHHAAESSVSQIVRRADLSLTSERVARGQAHGLRSRVLRRNGEECKSATRMKAHRKKLLEDY